MTTRRSTLLVTLVLMLVSAVAFAGKPGPGTKAVKSANNKIVKLLKKKADPSLVNNAVRGVLDIDELGKQAMANHWSSLSNDQQTKYLDLLHKLIEANYAKGMKANLTYKTKYTDEVDNGDGTRTVSTEVVTKRHGHPITIKIDYVLKQDAKGKWKAYDVITDKAGLVENYKAMFDKVIDKDGFDGLMQKMQKKLDEINADTAATASATP